jgi:hypothetical protein
VHEVVSLSHIASADGWGWRRLGSMARRTKQEAGLSGKVVFALLLNKSAIGIYSDNEKAEAAWDVFQEKYPKARGFAIKPFTLDGPPMIYQPY